MDKRFRLCIVVMLVFMIFNGVLEAGVNFHIRKVLGDLAIQGVVVTSGEGDTIRWLLQDMLDTTQTIEGRAYLQKNTDTTQTTPAYYTIYEDTIINGEALLQDTTEGISEGDKGEIEITIRGIINRAERTLGIRIYDLLGRERQKAILKPGQKTGPPQKTGTYILQTPSQTYKITTIQGKILTTKKTGKNTSTKPCQRTHLPTIQAHNHNPATIRIRKHIPHSTNHAHRRNRHHNHSIHTQPRTMDTHRTQNHYKKMAHRLQKLWRRDNTIHHNRTRRRRMASRQPPQQDKNKHILPRHSHLPTILDHRQYKSRQRIPERIRQQHRLHRSHTGHNNQLHTNRNTKHRRHTIQYNRSIL
ncbi:hypothetical protein DRQ17_01805 [bacterium]|nr:MAG: hypothetical protein DRQ17_01805 [bacterium]